MPRGRIGRVPCWAFQFENLRKRNSYSAALGVSLTARFTPLTGFYKILEVSGFGDLTQVSRHGMLASGQTLACLLERQPLGTGPWVLWIKPDKVQPARVGEGRLLQQPPSIRLLQHANLYVSVAKI